MKWSTRWSGAQAIELEVLARYGDFGEGLVQGVVTECFCDPVVNVEKKVVGCRNDPKSLWRAKMKRRLCGGGVHVGDNDKAITPCLVLIDCRVSKPRWKCGPPWLPCRPGAR